VSTATEEWRDDADIDFRQLLRTVWARRVLVGIVAAACGILAGAVSFVMTPVYRASTVLVPASDRGFGDASAALGQLGGLASLAGIEIGGSNVEVEEALAVLRSREFTEKFIREKNLLPVLFAHKWMPLQATGRARRRSGRRSPRASAISTGSCASSCSTRRPT
jgi:uncharacterized protein involved in exopolysaccharide biosynthesis